MQLAQYVDIRVLLIEHFVELRVRLKVNTSAVKLPLICFVCDNEC